MGGNSGKSFIVGVIAAAAVVATGGAAAAALFAFSVGSTVTGLILGPDQQEQSIRPEELTMTTSSEAVTVPVIFGTSRVSGNHIGWDRDSFRSEEVPAESGGKGGGGDQVAGYHYHMSFEVGLCMGPVDELVKISGSPGEDNVLFEEEEVTLEATLDITATTSRITGADDDFIDFEIGMSVYVEGAEEEANDGVRGTVKAVGSLFEYIELTEETFLGDDELAVELILTSATTQEPISLATPQTVTLEGQSDDRGTATIYGGTDDQVGPSINGTSYNYRGVCFVYYDDFQMGPSPAPRSYLYEMTRMPKCLDADGDAVVGMVTRASNSADEEEYRDANPAAIVWEIMTNKRWGKGMSPDLMNEEDFVLASIYYADQRIGISTSMSQGGHTQLIEKMRAIFGLAIWWDGEQLRCRVLWDRSNAYSPRPRITDEDIKGTPVFNRSSIASAINEIRLEFTNRVDLYQKQPVTIQDLGSIEAVGSVRSESVDGSEIGTRRAAQLLSARLLREMTYPPAQMSLNVNRAFANRGIGEFIELYWDAWREGGFTSFWRINSIEDDETGDDSVKLILIEDIYATSRDGEISDFTAPIVTLEVDTPLDDDSFGKIDYTVGRSLGAITPILLEEAPVWISKGKRQIIVGVQKENRSLQSFTAGWAEPDIIDYANLGVFRSFPITGTIMDDLGADGPKLIRNASNETRLALTRSHDESALLTAASIVQDGTEDFSDLTAKAQNILVIGGEIIRLGYVTEDATGEYSIKTAIRSELGTRKKAHTAGDTFWLFPIFEETESTIPATAVPIGTEVQVRLQPFAPRGSGDIVIIDGPDSKGFDGKSVRPDPPSFKEATRATKTWTIHIRPVIHWGGIGSGPNFEQEMLEELSIIDPMRIRIATSAGDSVTINEFFATGSQSEGNLEVTRAEWIPSVRGEKESGLIAITAVMTGTNPASVAIYQRMNGYESEPLTINQPT